MKYLAAELAAAEKKVEELQEAAIIAAERGDGSRGDEDGGGRAAWEAERREMDAEVARLHEHIEGSNAACEEKHAEVMSLQERLDTMVWGHFFGVSFHIGFERAFAFLGRFRVRV